MTNDGATEAAIRIGQKNADEVLAWRKGVRERRAAAIAAHPKPIRLNVEAMDFAGASLGTTSQETSGFLLAVGDSWFDYPRHDVLKLLDEYGYNVESAAHKGDRMESIAYQTNQLDEFASGLDKIIGQGGLPKAILISGGGDDIAGSEFGMLLNSAASQISGWNTEIVDGVVNQRILTAYKATLAAINRLCKQRAGQTFPILVHGYDYPVPDGRGFLGGWPFPGPWLEPGFHEKQFGDLQTNVELMRVVIDRFNAMLEGLVSDPAFPGVHYVNLRGKLSTELANDAYQEWWANELHPTEDGFRKVASEFAFVLSGL